jgi:MSHA biogenesis protein MshO
MRARGFTLVELVVAIAITGVVMAFAAMFIMAPVDGYEAVSRRAAVVDEVTAGWPEIEADLAHALPNSLRARRNGSFVVLEMLRVVDVVRYMATPSGDFNVAGRFRGLVVPFDDSTYYLSVYNCGPPTCADAYTLAGSMTPAATRIQIDDIALGQRVSVSPAPVFAADAPRHRMYLVSGPVTYLCDEGQGTVRRYTRYSVAANPASRDSPGELALAGASSTLVATGVTTCDFQASARSAVAPQTASLRLVATRASGESVTMFHSGGSGWVP